MSERPAAPALASAKGSAPAARSRRTLWLLLLIAAAPAVAAYAAFFLFHNQHRTNYGTLLTIAPAPLIEGRRSDGSPFRLTDLRGKWLLLVIAGGSCDPACERKLYATRQARTIQGKEQDRIERLWLIDDAVAPNPALLAQHPGLITAQVPVPMLDLLPAGRDVIYLIDPLGNLVLRYSDDPDIKAVARDLDRLLRVSRIG